ncbi:toll-like receptor Tollo [Scaptodrosophila lebanonensis]|uniref:Toll-like receptor Tollo n=1 Tax=Drosophila lebanonensis TaxID=7225 RepID=A0A6J2TI89_DROLE|nr:toll-like receptor Tollo [Scaptodrosophila lebanonensis]
MLAHHMQYVLIACCAIPIFGAALSKTVLHQAPDECRWSGVGENDITLVCHLRTINSELENTNFSVIQPQNTVRLRLQCNDALFFQSSLSSGSFQSLVELRDLTIEYCKLANLTDGSFRGLHELRNLTIRTHNGDWSTMSLEMASNSFADLRQLERLDLSLNNIWLVPDGVLCPLQALQHLNTSYNKIQDISNFYFSASLISRKARVCGSTLRTLDLSANKIISLPSAMLSALNRLMYLNVARNSMSFLADRAFEGLHSLRIVDLSANRLTSLPPELFSETKKLEEIFLRNNSINVLAPGIFGELPELVVLDLSRNELSSQWINAATFVGLRRLAKLDLSFNKINRLEMHIFRPLANLQLLKLEGNYIDQLPLGIFSDLSKLHTLILSNNRLSVIEQRTLEGLNELQVLSLDYNRIAKVDSMALLNCSQLQDLHLNGNKLQTVPPAFKHVPLLKTLDVGENLISQLENTSIISLENLYGLRMTENALTFIKRGIFDRMRSLQILNLSGNNIKNIEAGALQHNSQLQAIRLDGNHLKGIEGLFSELPNLVWLNISGNRLEKFDYSHIPICLQWLDVRANRITQLGHYFEIENQLRLSTFDASYNYLTELTASSIPNSVEVLYLNDNQINKIQPYTFFKKPNLTRVDLIRNKLTTLEPNALRLSPIAEDHAIPEFYIGHNDFECDCNLDWLQKINRESRTQPQLMDLEQIYCKLSYARKATHVSLIDAKPNDFLCKYESHCFALCHCCDFQACDCKMDCPSRCDCYHDQSWTSNVVDCSRAAYTRDLPGHIPMDATQLYLDGNNFRELQSHAFIGRKRLKILYLNHSSIEELNNRTFYGLLELEVLQLQHNRLNKLNGNDFQGLDNLKELYLQHNYISIIDMLTFTHLYNLKILRLDHNMISTFAVWNFLPSYLNELKLANNPWSCKCDFIDKFRDYINRHETVADRQKLLCQRASETVHTKLERFAIYLETEDLAKVVQCGSTLPFNPENNAERSEMGYTNELPLASNTNSTKMILTRPPKHEFVPILVAILATFIFALICILLLFIFRQEVRVWCHSRFGVRFFYNSQKDEDKNERDKLFDAFISYSSKDEMFVIEELAPLLELGKKHYKLCLHHRDFPVGGYVPENIVHAIDSSRRTIMVVSENFIKSEWCRFEFKSAHQSVLRDRRRRLIVIVLGKVPQKDLDPDLRLYLKTNSYLQWGEKLFWQKLRFALPDVPHSLRGASSGQPCHGPLSHVTYHTHHHVHQQSPQPQSHHHQFILPQAPHLASGICEPSAGAGSMQLLAHKNNNIGSNQQQQAALLMDRSGTILLNAPSNPQMIPLESSIQKHSLPLPPNQQHHRKDVPVILAALTPARNVHM